MGSRVELDVRKVRRTYVRARVRCRVRDDIALSRTRVRVRFPRGRNQCARGIIHRASRDDGPSVRFFATSPVPIIEVIKRCLSEMIHRS